MDRFICNSHHTWNRFGETYPEFSARPFEVVPLGIGEPVAGGSAGPGPVPAALIVSRLSKDEDYKGHRELIAAWPRVGSAVPGAELWIAGDGELRPDLERLAQSLGVSGAVKFFGRVSEDKKVELFRESRCFVMPSRAEGFGLAYLEAMRVGRPCLVSTSDAGREVVNPPECGLAVDPGDAGELTASLVRLLTPGRKWDEWSIRSRSRYESQFTARHFQARIVEAMNRFSAGSWAKPPARSASCSWRASAVVIARQSSPSKGGTAGRPVSSSTTDGGKRASSSARGAGAPGLGQG